MLILGKIKKKLTFVIDIFLMYSYFDLTICVNQIKQSRLGCTLQTPAGQQRDN